MIFVCFSAVSFLIQYRFIYLSKTVTLIPGISVSLSNFATIILSIGTLILMVVGLILRAPDGYGAEMLRKFDVTGIIICMYSVLLFFLEAILLKEPIDLPYIDGIDSAKMDSDGIYEPYMPFITGILLICISGHLKRTKFIKAGTSMIAISASIGKMLAFIIDLSFLDISRKEGDVDLTFSLISRGMISSLLLIVIFAPYVFMEPSRFKYRLKRSLGPTGKPIDTTPASSKSTVFGYCAVALPAIIVLSIPTVLKPLLQLCSSGAYYSTSPAFSEIVGFASSIWGLSVLSMINHYLPDGGADAWRKGSASMFLLGLGVLVAAPTLPGGTINAAPSSAFATISSIGYSVAQGRSGGWGIVAATLACLLAMTGPLDLRWKNDRYGTKDPTLLPRLMIFSILFGCGISWFIVIQSMSEASFLPLFLTALSSMAMSFFGTIASVLGYFLDTQNFDEAEQIVKVWVFSFPMFLFISGMSMMEKDESPPFIMGGWLSTYLTVCGCCTLAFAAAVRCRSDKSSATRGLGNMSCIISWALAIIVIYGLFGLAGIGVSSGVILGCPVSLHYFILAPFKFLYISP